MAGMGNPDYSRGKIMFLKDFNRLSFNELLYSYTIIKCKFKFKNDVKYPSIPVFVDETTTVYPLKGEAIITGSEYLLAKAQKCEMYIQFIYYIPFEKKIIEDVKSKKTETMLINKPFERIIKDVQKMRREHPKGTVSNLMYKELGNSIYGSVVRGMSDKRKFDIKSGRTIRMEGGDLSNPILAS